MATVREIFQGLGGHRVISAKTGIPLTTVHSWQRADFVPAWRVPTLLQLARKMKKPLREEDFPAARPAAGKADEQVAA